MASERPWFVRWMLACTAGELLGFGCAALWAWLAFSLFGADPVAAEARAAVLGLMVLAGVTEGAVLGLLQWRVLRQRFAGLSAPRFVGATVLVAAVGWAVGMLPSTLAEPVSMDAVPYAPAFDPPLALVLASAVVFGALAGALFGWAQARVLRAHTDDARAWILGNARGWALGLPFSVLAASSVDLSHSVPRAVLAAAVGGALMGASVALLTGRAALAMRVRAM